MLRTQVTGLPFRSCFPKCRHLSLLPAFLCSILKPKVWSTHFSIMPPLFLPLPCSICSKACFTNVADYVIYLSPAGKSSARISGITPLTCCVLCWLFLYWQNWELALRNSELKSMQRWIKMAELNFRLQNICQANAILKNANQVSLAQQD